MSISQEQRARYQAARRRKYAEDAEYRARVNARNLKWRAAKGAAFNKSRREKRLTDPVWREEQNAKRRGRDQRDGQLKTHYGLSLDEYNEKKSRQGQFCAVCGKRSDETLCVDHDHKTGKVRDLLCRKCNTGLGCYLDSPALLRIAAHYLEKWHGH